MFWEFRGLKCQFLGSPNVPQKYTFWTVSFLSSSYTFAGIFFGFV